MAASDMEMFEAQEHIAALEAENERLRAVVDAARWVSSYTRTEPVDDIVNVLDALDDALAALDEEATNETR